MFDAYLRAWDMIPDGAPIITRASHLLPVRQRGVAAMLKIADHDDERTGGAQAEAAHPLHRDVGDAVGDELRGDLFEHPDGLRGQTASGLTHRGGGARPADDLRTGHPPRSPGGLAVIGCWRG